MTIDDKVRFGVLALGGTALVLTAMGVHPGPLTTGLVGSAGGL